MSRLAVAAVSPVIAFWMTVALLLPGCAPAPPPTIQPVPATSSGPKLPAVELVMPAKLQALSLSQRSALFGLGIEPVRSELGKKILSLLRDQLGNHYSRVLVSSKRSRANLPAVMVRDLSGEISPSDLSYEARLKVAVSLPDGPGFKEQELLGQGEGNGARLFWLGAMGAKGILARAEQKAFAELSQQLEDLMGEVRVAQQALDGATPHAAVTTPSATVASQPARAGRPAAEGAQQNAATSAPSQPGSGPPPRLGIRIQPMTPELAGAFAQPTTSGVLVAEVEEGGPAALAGLKPGDVILSLNQKPVQNPRKLTEMVRCLAPGDAALLRVWRAGEPFFLTAHLAGRGSSAGPPAASDLPPKPETGTGANVTSPPSPPTAAARPPGGTRAAGKEQALAYYRQGMEAVQRARNTTDLRKAAESFSLAVQAAPDWPAARYNLARILEELDRPYGAMKTYRKYLKLAPDAPNRTAVLERIAKLRGLLAKKKRIQLPGVTFAAMPDGIYVLHLLPGVRIGNSDFLKRKLGARASALKRGDRIIEVNTHPVAGASLEEFFRRIDQGISQRDLQRPMASEFIILKRLVAGRNIRDRLAYLKVIRGGATRYIICSKEVFSSRLVNMEAEELKDTLTQGQGKLVAFFWANWCPPCARYTPTIEQLSESFGNRATFASINIEEDKRGTKALGVDRIPTLIVYDHGREQARLSGAKTQGEVVRFLKQHLY